MDSQKEGWSCQLFMICVLTTIGVGLPVGYCFAALNGNAGVRRVRLSPSVAYVSIPDRSSFFLSVRPFDNPDHRDYEIIC